MNDMVSFRQWLQALGLVLVGHIWITLPAMFLVVGISVGTLVLMWFWGEFAGSLYWLVPGNIDRTGVAEGGDF